jgi:xanthine dehydrogenase accessory factor
MTAGGARAQQQTAATVLRWLAEDRRVATGALVGVDGSAPFDVGATVYVDADGAIEGNVTGGCVEGAVAQEADALIQGGDPARVVTYGISDELAGTVGLRCGGTVRVLIGELRTDAREATRRALEALVADEPHAIARVLNGPQSGATMYVDASSREGALGATEKLDASVEQAARGLLGDGRSALRRFGSDGAVLGSDVEVHITVHADPPQMIIFGAIDYAVALASLAGGVGYRVTIADPRTAFLASDRFSAVARTVPGWPQEVMTDVTLGPRDAVLVFTHDMKLDVAALQEALGSGAGYVGALGSRKTTAAREERLRETGLGDTAIARIHAPCGLDIGAATVEETAIAVMAEITANREGRAGGFLRDSSASIGRRNAGSPATA